MQNFKSVAFVQLIAALRALARCGLGPRSAIRLRYTLVHNHRLVRTPETTRHISDTFVADAAHPDRWAAR